MRRTRSVLEHFAQTVGLDVLPVLGIVLMGAFKVWPLTAAIAVNLAAPATLSKDVPAHLTSMITHPRFDQQQPNFATEPSQYPAATGSANVYN